MRPIDADAYAAEMKKRQDACMEAMEIASYDGEQFSRKEHWEGVLAAFAEAKLTLDDMPTIGGWISVKDDLPTEHDSIFAHMPLVRGMWAKESDDVIVYVRFPDGTGRATEGQLQDGKWRTRISRTLDPVVTHWQPFPEPPKEGNG